jgi:hypothetical protein
MSTVRFQADTQIIFNKLSLIFLFDHYKRYTFLLKYTVFQKVLLMLSLECMLVLSWVEIYFVLSCITTIGLFLRRTLVRSDRYSAFVVDIAKSFFQYLTQYGFHQMF